MKTIFNLDTEDQLINRLVGLSENSVPKWGKMSAYQMIEHCIKSEKMYQQVMLFERLFIGKLIGGIARKAMLKNEAPLKINQPTHPTFKIEGEGNFNHSKSQWIKLLRQYNELDDSVFLNFIHPFFGKMKKEEVGFSVYKHTDHHLRQFNL